MTGFAPQDDALTEAAPIYAHEIKQFKKDSRNAHRDYRTRAFLNSKFGKALIIAALPFYIFFKKASKAPAISMMLALSFPLLASIHA